MFVQCWFGSFYCHLQIGMPSTIYVRWYIWGLFCLFCKCNYHNFVDMNALNTRDLSRSTSSPLTILFIVFFCYFFFGKYLLWCVIIFGLVVSVNIYFSAMLFFVVVAVVVVVNCRNHIKMQQDWYFFPSFGFPYINFGRDKRSRRTFNMFCGTWYLR